MAFKLPSAIFQKVARFKALKYMKGGALTLWGNPCILMPIHTQFYLYKLLVKNYGINEAKKILYNMGKFQAKTGFEIVIQKFGYKKTIKDQKKLLNFNTGQTEILGLGSYNFIRVDFKSGIFIGKGNSPYAHAYKELEGFTKENIDYFFAGSCAGAVEAIIGKEVIAIETNCIAKGDKYCEFLIKVKNKWDKNDPLIKKNIYTLKKNMTLKDLGIKNKQTLILH